MSEPDVGVASHRLVFARTRSYDLITDENRAPLWPVVGPTELDALCRLSTILDFELDESHVAFKSELEGNVSSTVVGLGDECFEHARLYAHLTKRQLTLAADLDDLELSSPPSVIVTLLENITGRLFDVYRQWLVTPIMQEVPGFIVAATSALLWKQVLVRSAAAHFYTEHKNHKASRSEFRRRANRVDNNVSPILAAHDDGLLIFHTHSDGIDAKLPEGKVLCALDSYISNKKSAESEGELIPTCVIRNFCHRLKLALPHALQSTNRVEASSIEAPILFFDACSIFRPWGNLLDEKYTLLNAFLENSNTAVIVTNSESAINNIAQAGEVARALRSGVSVGSAIASFLCTRSARNSGRLLFIIGDPRVRVLRPCSSDWQTLDARKSHEFETPVWTNSTARISVSDRDLQDAGADESDPIFLGMRLAFLKGCIEEGTRNEDDSSEFLRDLNRSLCQISSNFSNKSTEMIAYKEYAALMPKVMEFIHAENFTDLWVRRYGVGFSGSCVCPSCGTTQSRFNSNLKVKPLMRILTLCQYCGISQDAYPNNRIGIRLLSSRDVQLLGNVRDSGWAGELSAWVGGDLLARWDWPNPSGYLERQFHITEGLPSGLFRVHLWLHRRFEIVGASVRCRL